MKVRLGFVSNSSSSSFVAFGVALNHDYFSNDEDEDDSSNSKNEDKWTYPTPYKFTKELEKIDSRFDYGIQDDIVYIGIPVSSVEDNETIGAVKDIVKKAFMTNGKNLMAELEKEKKTLDIKLIEETWYG